MAISQNNPQVELSSKEQSSNAIDLKRILHQVLRYWYFVIGSLLLFLTIAFYNVRYAQRIYPVSASLIIREKEETSGAELLYKNALIDQYRNYLNEPYILRSYPIVQRTVEELHFLGSFYKEGRVLITESYNQLPYRVVGVKIKDQSSVSYTFKAIDNARYTLKPLNAERNANEYRYGEKVFFEDAEFSIERNRDSVQVNPDELEYLLVLRSSSTLTAEYVSKLKVDWAEKGAGVMNLSMVSSNPRKEIDFINTLIKNYQLYDLEKKNLTANRTVSFIKGQLENISDSLKLFEVQLEQFKKSNRTTGDLSIDAQRLYAKVEGLDVQKTELLIKANYYNYLNKYLTESKDLDQIILPASMGITDPIINSLVGKIVDLQLELKLFNSREKSVNPIITNRQNRLKELKSELLASIESLRSTDKVKDDFLKKQIDAAERQIGYLPLAQRTYISIQRNYSLLENLFVYLMQKKSEAEISKAANVSDLIIVNPPMQLGGAISPKPQQTYLLLGFIGLLIPLLVFVLVDFFNTRIQSKEDIERFTTIPFVGGIGHKKNSLNLEVFNSPKSGISESFRALRSNLAYFTGNSEKAVIVVASSISGEGKTFSSINLASVFALSGKKTLILGADMRKPKLYQDFNLKNNTGLSTFLAGIDQFQDVVQTTDFPHLDLVSGGPTPPNPAELLLNKRMDEFIQLAKAKYDYVVIDTPPLAIVTDAFALCGYADHIIFLVRQNYTPKELLKTTQDHFVSGRLKNISIVFNDVYKSGLGYGYGYGYGYLKRADGYGYYSESNS